MKELYIRGISGGLYVALIVGSVFTHQLLFTLTILLFSTLAIIEFQRLIHHKSYMPMALVLLLVYNFYQSKIEVSDLLYPLISIFIAHFFLLYWLFTQKKIQFGYLSKTLLTLFYVGLGCFFIITLGGSGSDYHTEDVLLFYLLIWTNNSFAYLVGRKFGKNPLYAAISPNKSWEGFFGGLIFCGITALIFWQFYPEKSLSLYMLIAIVTACLSSIGDLIQSQFKRQAMVKDSGSLIPGHGGFFDRMDSAIFTAPWFYLILNFKEYVS